VGKHSSPSGGAFYRSLVGSLLPWALISAVVAVGIWVGVGAVGSEDPEQTPPANAVAQAPPSPTPSVTPTASPTRSPDPKKTAADKKEPDRKKGDRKDSKKPKNALITADVTVQVLNGTGAPYADDDMADQLARLGFEVVAVDGSSRAYAETTVFWSFAEARKAAEALARKYGWAVGPKPSNLSTTVDLHVIVGDDYV